VVDFRVSHFGSGMTHDAAGMFRAARAFGLSWGRRRILPAYAHVTWTCVAVARWDWLRKLMSHRQIQARLKSRLLL
jgi:hypothetical protein